MVGQHGMLAARAQFGDVSLADFQAMEAQRTQAQGEDEDSDDRTRLTLQSRADTN